MPRDTKMVIGTPQDLKIGQMLRDTFSGMSKAAVPMLTGAFGPRITGDYESMIVQAMAVSIGDQLRDCPEPERGRLVEVLQELIARFAKEDH